MKNSSLILLVTFFLSLLVLGSSLVTSDVLLIECTKQLQQKEDRYKERAGLVRLSDGRWGKLHIVSIDAGKNWLVITRGREVVHPPYLHQKYPEINPDSLKIIEP